MINKKIKLFNFLSNNKGFAALFVAILVLVILLFLLTTLITLAQREYQIAKKGLDSTQAYYASEAGVEDALLRIIKPQMSYPSSYSFPVGEGAAEVSIGGVSTSLTVESIGDRSSARRSIETNIIVSASDVSFHYGVQVGAGGLTMSGNSQILGNVYSNGPVSASSNAKLYGDVYSAGAAGAISGLRVYKSEAGSEDGNAHAHSVSNSNIQNGVYYQNISGTTAGSYYPGSPDPEIKNLPISENEIVKWKDDAAAGGTISGYYLGSNDVASLGPIKVNGDFEINNNAQLTVNGTIWVTGKITLASNALLQLNSSYGTNSGVILSDGKISSSGNVVICGSEGFNVAKRKCNPGIGSFLMFLSTNNSLNPSSPAIQASSNSKAAIFYAGNGVISITSNAELKEVTGYALYLSSNAEITYETGLADAIFTSGPGGSWQVSSWKEVE